MGRGIALLFHDHSTRRWVVSSTPRPHFTPGKEPVPIVQEAGWAPGPVWMGRKSRPHRDSIPDRPARSQSLYRMSYLAHILRSSDIDKTSGKWSCLCAYAWCSAFGVCVCVCVCVCHTSVQEWWWTIHLYYEMQNLTVPKISFSLMHLDGSQI